MKNKTIKIMFAFLVFAFANPANAHDEGHGPKLTDTGRFGGVITAVVESKDASLGATAPLVYKAELTRSDDKTVRVYVYDKDMKAIPMDQLNAAAEAKLIAMSAGKESVVSFSLKLQNNAYVGIMPEPASKPYNIDVTFAVTQKNLLAAFDNLD